MRARGELLTCSIVKLEAKKKKEKNLSKQSYGQIANEETSIRENLLKFSKKVDSGVFGARMLLVPQQLSHLQTPLYLQSQTQDSLTPQQTSAKLQHFSSCPRYLLLRLSLRIPNKRCSLVLPTLTQGMKALSQVWCTENTNAPIPFVLADEIKIPCKEKQAKKISTAASHHSTWCSVTTRMWVSLGRNLLLFPSLASEPQLRFCLGKEADLKTDSFLSFQRNRLHLQQSVEKFKHADILKNTRGCGEKKLGRDLQI